MSNESFVWPLESPALAQSWNAAWSALGQPAPLELRRELERAWSEPHRHYHDTRHLGECLALCSRWADGADRSAEVALAIWFHDAIHDPKLSANEVKSAAWAARSLVAAGLGSEVAQRVYDLVLATRHDKPVQGRDAALVVDIDLAILGSPSERFEAYDRDIRKEYAWVSGFRYRSQRRHVLQGFLSRARIYETACAAELLEEQARINLQGALERLAQ